MPIAPMIDCVFLMLVYFMTTSSLEKAEAELLVKLSGAAAIQDPLTAFDTQTIQIDETGRASINGYDADNLSAGWRAGLVKQLKALRHTCEASQSELKVVVAPHSQTPHRAIIDVLDALETAEVESVSFQ